MTTTSALYPATVSTSAALAPYDDNDWTSPSYVGADDTNYASITGPTFDTNDYSYRILATNFGFAIPTGARIDGITVKVARYYADGAVIDALVQLTKTGTAVGDNKSAGATWATSMAEVSFGGATDKWGATWTAAEINASTFGVHFACQSNGTDSDAYVDFITVTVDYTVLSLACDYGSLALTGQDVTFKRGEVLTCEYGAFTLTGQDATLKAARKMTCTMRMYNTMINSLETEIIPLAPLVYFPGGETEGTVERNIGTLGMAANGVISGVTLNAIDGPGGTRAGLWDGVNDYVNIYSAALIEKMGLKVGSMLAFKRVFDLSVFTDGISRTIVSYGNVNDIFYFRKSNVNNTLRHDFNGTLSAAYRETTSYVNMDWTLHANTWNSNTNEYKAYINSSQLGTTLSGIGDLTTPVTGRVVIGCRISPSGEPWYGYISTTAFFDYALTLEQVQTIYAAGQEPAWTTITVQRKVTAEQASYALTGQDCTLTYTPGAGEYTLTCEYGSFTLTGQDAGLVAARKITADYGSYVLSGQDVMLKAARLMAAVYGAFALTGQDAGVYAGRLISAEVGSYALSGQTATLIRALVLAAGSGMYSLSGQDVTFDYSGTPNILVCNYGLFTLTGQAINFVNVPRSRVYRPSADNRTYRPSADNRVYRPKE